MLLAILYNKSRVDSTKREAVVLDIREARKTDLASLLELYTHLHENDMPVSDESLEALWDEMLLDKNHHIIVGTVGDRIVSSCVLVVIPNLTRDQRPYALIENVVTHVDYRGRGYGTLLLDFAGEIAKKDNCYKIMLLTGSKKEGTLKFYEKAGYNSKDKTAFIKWL